MRTESIMYILYIDWMAVVYLHLVHTVLPQLYRYKKLWLGRFAYMIPFPFSDFRWGKAVDLVMPTIQTVQVKVYLKNTVFSM